MEPGTGESGAGGSEETVKDTGMEGDGNPLEFIVEFADRLLLAAGLSVKVREERDGTTLHLQLHGPDSGIVLANNARVLYSLEHVLNQVLYRHGKGDQKVMLDCNGYRSMRILELQLMARKAAERVRTTGAAFSLQPMPSTERRVIHLALAEDHDVHTESSGLGMNRHVVILPGARV